MKVIKTAKQHLLVLSKGEEIIETILGYCRTENIDAAWINAIGAVTQAELALYDLETKEYHRQNFSKPMELVSLIGNITLFQGKVAAHLHAVLSDDKMQCIGGHLSRAIVAATCEIKIEIIAAKLERRLDEEIGLNILG